MNRNMNFRFLTNILLFVFLLLLLAVLSLVVVLRTQQAPANVVSLPALSQSGSVPGDAASLAALPTSTPAPSATPQPTPVPEPQYYTISLVGDCTLAENYDWRGRAAAYQSVVGNNYAYPFSNTVEYFRDDYLTVANLECTLTDNKYDSIEWYHFLAPAAYASILTEGCVDFVTLANNHVMDYGSAAYGDMLRALDSVSMAYAGENETYVFQREDGLRVGIYCLYNQKVPTKELLDAGLKKLREAGAQFTIAALHWGVEGAYSISETQTTMGHYAIDAGFDVVYGSHPHRLEPLERYNGGLIFYSMANWSFGGHTDPDDYDTAIAQFTVKLVGDEATVDSVTLTPCSISSSDSINNYCPTPYEEGSEEWNRAMSKLDGTFEGADYKADYQSLVYGT